MTIIKRGDVYKWNESDKDKRIEFLEEQCRLIEGELISKNNILKSSIKIKNNSIETCLKLLRQVKGIKKNRERCIEILKVALYGEWE